MITLILWFAGFFVAPTEVPVNIRIGAAGNDSRVSMAYLEPSAFICSLI